MEIEIRKMQAADAPAVAALLRALGLFARIEREPAELTEQRVARHLALCGADESHLVLVGQAGDGAIAGYCAAHWLPYLILPGPEGYVSELFIAESFRGQGLGRRLLEAVKAAALERGCSRLMLLNMRTRESYKRGFYAKQGWEERPGAANFILPLNGAEAPR